jgi:hypothetical protein
MWQASLRIAQRALLMTGHCQWLEARCSLLGAAAAVRPGACTPSKAWEDMLHLSMWLLLGHYCTSSRGTDLSPAVGPTTRGVVHWVAGSVGMDLRSVPAKLAHPHHASQARALQITTLYPTTQAAWRVLMLDKRDAHNGARLRGAGTASCLPWYRLDLPLEQTCRDWRLSPAASGRRRRGPARRRRAGWSQRACRALGFACCAGLQTGRHKTDQGRPIR